MSHVPNSVVLKKFHCIGSCDSHTRNISGLGEGLKSSHIVKAVAVLDLVYRGPMTLKSPLL